MLYIFNTNHGRTVAKIALASQLFQFIFIPIASAVEQTNELATATVSNYAQTQAVNGLEAWLNQYGNSRIKTHYDFDAEKFDDSSIDMLFALKDNGSDVTFTQFGYRHYDNRNTVNLGLGYRQLDEHYLWGVNAFYDRDLTGQNDRVSLGGEYFRDYLRINANGYLGLTNWHDSEDVWFEGNKTIYLQEKPADGVDIMMNAYLPDYPQLGLKLGYEQYFGEQVNLFGSDDLESDPYALTVGLNHTPVPLVTWGVDHKQGKHGSDDTRIYIGLNYRFGETLENQINQENVNSLRTFKTGRLDLVERNNVITLDYRRKPVDNRATQSLANASITIAADKPVVVADGTSTTIALGILADEFGNPIVNQEINVEITLEGVTTTTRVTTDSEGKYAVPVPSSSTAGAIANITATTVNLPTNISASTSVLYNGDITTKQLTFNSVKDLLVANIMNYSDLIVTVTDTSGRPIINEEVTIVNKESGETYTGITDATGKFVYEYAPYDPNDKTRFVPGTNIVFEANFVNDPQELKIDQLTLSYGRIEANVNEQTSSLAINVPAEHKFTLKPLMNAIDLTSAQPSVVVDLETKFGLVEEIDYEIEVTPTREIGLSGSYMAVEFDVYITLLDTANTRAKLSEITFNDYYRIDVVRLDIPQIDPKLYALNKITKEYFFIF